MTILKQDTDLALERLAKAKRIVCVTHRNPDGDAIGSLLGMGMLLDNVCNGTQVILFDKDPAPDTFSFLPNVQHVQNTLQPAEGDLYVFLDAAEPKLTGMHESNPELFDGTYASINIDHHPTNSKFASINFIEPDAASSCEIVVEIADMLGWEITGDIATCLLTGVYTDTGGLLHSNTTASVYRTVARLLRAGARQQEIVKAVFRTASMSTLRLWGRVLEHISLSEEGGAISAVMEEDFRATGAHYSQLTGAIDYVNAVPGMKFSLILSEREGVVKGSLRTLRDDVDVAAMAGKFSGGGHKKAAGFSIPGTLKPEVRWKVVEPVFSASEEADVNGFANKIDNG
ncbi:bifunctional oligoribonuclease/PAP phosphatase NrnA [Patescibacteria group bacterium]|nr:bifunctional oligoribonuclease/PAP phosphatase NrnA [Patescibacteria group bacterium]MBU1123668.1 bifunctional oligoribonuclease/PAP phosphatase NrnA [Patescibacteria group bacterium]MBU1911775.1 bifunctional oligoribonuclease/PAP phosphatase NrnA [Patescibacteria group bacterium]